ncbi:methylmalonyl Co-A mutase-associated GTPase MeaB [Wenxinia marina]|uniref:LAO/AO transport system ATPase n=1 Tax=Wenxinia marina DSM 24838 TaxID=1123501 RepID=A0A0D0QCD4_9RHOB|nr:methylmalonyl Co-A mutase-associated GTPase MeaB [Wenxinia marina]KIQ68603.1 LAO/AO transport system ATPase [Wenxinia marina DSM 24838]GGL67223.1 ATPase/protein kinase [Wenxinia marina]
MDNAALAEAVRRGERRALARAITLVESGRADHRAAATDLLARLADPSRQALRVGLSGTPGVGKSTFIDALGLHLTAQGLKVAVLAVDPSSARSGGSILGDKTRMERLSRDPAAFIRPSPAASQLGGVARRTREAVSLCEAAGFDVVLVETVGVGQSETMVAQLVDVFVLLLAPAGGDELQGVKRGIMESADILLVNKADGDLAAEARRTAADYAGALRLLRKRPQDPDGYPLALTVSAATGAGIDIAWDAVTRLADLRRAAGILNRTRAEQARHWFAEELRAEMLTLLTRDPDLKARLARLEEDVAAGRTTPAAAAAEALRPLAATPPPGLDASPESP